MNRATRRKLAKSPKKVSSENQAKSNSDITIVNTENVKIWTLETVRSFVDLACERGQESVFMRLNASKCSPNLKAQIGSATFPIKVHIFIDPNQ